MKKISVTIALCLFTISILNSCQNNPESTKNSEQELANQENQAPENHPPRRKGDRKGPPPGGGKGPEQTKTLEEIGGYQIGDIATDFKLKNVDETMFSLADIENAKGYIVVFTCNECPFAKMYEDRLIQLHKDFAPRGFSVVAINPNSPENESEGFEAMKLRAEEKQFPFAYLVDEGQKIYPQYGAVRTPHVFLLDAERKVQYIGTIDDNAKHAEEVKVKFLEDAIQALENGESPNPNFTKAIGCPVKAKRA